MSTVNNLLRKLAAALLAVAAAGGTAHANTSYGTSVHEGTYVGHAKATIVHQRCREVLYDLELGRDVPAYRDDAGVLVPGQRWVTASDGVTQLADARDYETIFVGDAINVKPTVSIDFIFVQSYNSAATAQTTGMSFIALSNDTLTETTASTTLSTEIAANGLTRAAGTFAHTTAASTATITKTFTATGAQSCQKAALFSASSGGTMGHALSFTQRALVSTDTIAITYTITLT